MLHCYTSGVFFVDLVVLHGNRSIQRLLPFTLLFLRMSTLLMAHINTRILHPQNLVLAKQYVEIKLCTLRTYKVLDWSLFTRVHLHINTCNLRLVHLLLTHIISEVLYLVCTQLILFWVLNLGLLLLNLLHYLGHHLLSSLIRRLVVVNCVHMLLLQAGRILFFLLGVVVVEIAVL